MKRNFDVVVVGAGINGLACGAYLAKAGLDVAVLEKRNECGPFALTEDLFGAGVPVDTHAGVCFLPMSPVWGNLELGKFGLELMLPEVPAGTLWKDRNILYSFNPQKSIEAIARYSAKDAKTFARLLGSIAPHVVDIAEKIVFSPPTDEGEDFMFDIGKYAGFSAQDMRTMNGFELLDLLYEDEFVKMSLLGVANIGVFGDPAEKGEGSLMTLLTWALAIGVPRGGMHNLVHALVRCFRHHGGTLMLNAPVEEVTWAAGRPTGVVLSPDSAYGDIELEATNAVVMHVSPPIALGLLGEDNVKENDADLHRQMKLWDMTGHCAFTSYFLLDGLPSWGSASWDPGVQQCAFPLRAWDSWDHAKRSFQYAKNEELFAVAGDVGEIYNLTAVDKTRQSPDGKSVVVFEVEYPVNLRRYGGMEAWDNREITDQLHNNHLNDLEMLAPGFRKYVLNSKYATPIDNWRRNPSAIYGHELGGDVSGAQWYQGRMPNRSNIPGLYFSQGVWPASLTHLGNGHVTAGCVAEDLGVRDQEWWCHKPFELAYELMGGLSNG